MDFGDSDKDLPLAFELNQGQAHSKIKFLAHSRKYSLFMTSSEIYIVLSDPYDYDFFPDKKNSNKPRIKVIKMSFIDSNIDCSIEGMDKYPVKMSYLVGNIPKHYPYEFPTYAKVKYNCIYPGIDLVYYGNGQRIEYDFMISPGYTPGDILINFEGVDNIEIDSGGNLILKFDGGSFTFFKPLAFQIKDSLKFEIPCKYVLDEYFNVGFEISDYDPQYSIIIDPVMNYKVLFYRSSPDDNDGVALDPLKRTDIKKAALPKGCSCKK